MLTVNYLPAELPAKLAAMAQSPGVSPSGITDSVPDR